MIISHYECSSDAYKITVIVYYKNSGTNGFMVHPGDVVILFPESLGVTYVNLVRRNLLIKDCINVKNVVAVNTTSMPDLRSDLYYNVNTDAWP